MKRQVSLYIYRQKSIGIKVLKTNSKWGQDVCLKILFSPGGQSRALEKLRGNAAYEPSVPFSSLKINSKMKHFISQKAVH